MTDRTFRERSTAILGVLALLLVSWLVPPAAASGAASLASACPSGFTTTSVFGDVATSGTHAAAISCLHSWGVVNGNADGSFQPTAIATRAQFAMVLHGLLDRAGHAPPDGSGTAFTDVGAGHVARGAIAALAGAGIVNGTTPTTFAPNRAINRAQMASMIVRAHDRVFGLTMAQGPTFSDTAGTTHEDTIRRLAGTGITVGYTDGTYRPTVALTREQMATFLARYLDRLVSDGTAPAPDELRTRRVNGPDRTIVEDQQGRWIATFTDGARTVALAGPARRFDEATAADGVTSRTWVRLLPQPFDGRLDRGWLERARGDRSPDVLATSMTYIAGAPDVYGSDGLLLSADASYGPLRTDGYRPIGSDWNDFQGVPDPFAPSVRQPRADRYQSVDCSGYIRLLFGVRFGLPMGRYPDGGATLPRRSMHQASDAPGVVPYADRGTRLTSFDRLQPGDLVFFDATADAADAIDHVGMYLGPDDAGRHRFVSSRRSIDGPTMGDFSGASLLDGTGLYARSFRSTRRL